LSEKRVQAAGAAIAMAHLRKSIATINLQQVPRSAFSGVLRVVL